MIEEFDETLELGSLVESAKEMLEIDKPNWAMLDDEIKRFVEQ